jgi:hypothetical protein
MFRTYPLVLGAVVLLMTALMIGCPFVAHYELASDGSGQGQGGGEAGPPKECTTAAECDDQNPCTTDTCAEYKCIHVADDTAKPDAGDEPSCKARICVNGVPALAPAALGTPCASGTPFCGMMGTCVPCTANVGCSDGTTCFNEKECVSCTDKSKNSDETDIDCGGSCGKCNDGMTCAQNKDCIGNQCDINGICISCDDKIKNGDEAAMDCGGSACGACQGVPCSSDAACASSSCVDGVCCAVTCSGGCEACNLPGSVGTCTQLPSGYNDLGCSSASEVCKKGMCVSDMGKLHFGETCSANTDCFSNQCVGTTCK